MATWEDGPEYAPLVRPDGFQVPDVAPLEIVPAQGSLLTQAPDAAPAFQPSATPGPPLESLAPQRTETRDPSQPFEVVEAAATADTSGWSSAHSSSLIQQPGGWGPPSGPPVAGPAGPPTPTVALRDASAPFQLTHQGSQLQPTADAYPQPGTVQWFAPPPAGAVPVSPAPQLSVPQALTWGYIVVLVVSVTWVIAPATLIIGAILANQVKVANALIRRIRTGAMITFGVIAVLAIPLGDGTLDGWWGTISTWALLIALILLLVSVIVVMRHANTNAGSYPPPGSNWG